jgi:hypothetical protein
MFACFVDLRKAYNYVNRDTLWYFLGRQGVPTKLVELLWDLHMGIITTIKVFGGNFSLLRSRAGFDRAAILNPKLKLKS